MSIVLVSHDLNLVKKFADKVILLDKRVIKQGTVEKKYLIQKNLKKDLERFKYSYLLEKLRKK